MTKTPNYAEAKRILADRTADPSDREQAGRIVTRGHLQAAYSGALPRVTKAKAGEQLAVFDQKGNLLGFCEATSVIPLTGTASAVTKTAKTTTAASLSALARRTGTTPGVSRALSDAMSRLPPQDRRVVEQALTQAPRRRS